MEFTEPDRQWALDDNFCLAFLFGASQLVDSAYLPDSILNAEETRELSEDYIYFICTQNTRKLKPKKNFSDVQPMQNDISAVPDWETVVKGLQKLFVTEVLGQIAVVKHLHFGSLLCY